MGIKITVLVPAVFLIAARPQLAVAHSFFGDAQPLLNGFLHPFITISHLVLLFSIGLLVLTQKKSEIVLFLMIGILLGFMAQVFGTLFIAEISVPLLLLFFGSLIALNQQIRWFILALPFVLTGFIVGLETLPELEGLLARMIFYFGTFFAVVTLMAYVLLLKGFIKKEWAWIVVRVLGSWAFAVGLMWLAFKLSAV